MVSQNTVRTYGVNEVVRFVEGIWLHRLSCQILFFFIRKDLFYFIRACSELLFVQEVVAHLYSKLLYKMGNY